MSKPWNWCRKCKQPVDLPDEVSDGSEVACIGCRGVFVAVSFTDDSWRLIRQRRATTKRKRGDR